MHLGRINRYEAVDKSGKAGDNSRDFNHLLPAPGRRQPFYYSCSKMVRFALFVAQFLSDRSNLVRSSGVLPLLRANPNRVFQFGTGTKKPIAGQQSQAREIDAGPNLAYCRTVMSKSTHQPKKSRRQSLCLHQSRCPRQNRKKR